MDYQLKEERKITFIQTWMQYYGKISALNIRKDEFSQQQLQNNMFKCCNAKIHIPFKTYGLFFVCFHSDEIVNSIH